MADLLQGLSESKLGVGLTQTLLGTGILWGGTELLNVTKILPTAINQFKNLIDVIAHTAGGALTLSESFAAFGGVMGSLFPIVLAVVGGFVAISAVVKEVKEKLDFEYQIEELEQQKTEYDEIIARMEELKSYGKDITKSEQIELSNLKKKKQLLEDNLEITKKQAREDLDRELKREAYGRFIRPKGAREGIEVLQTGFGGDVKVWVEDFRAIDDLLMKNQKNTRVYGQTLKDYTDKWSDLANKLKEYRDIGGELSRDEQDLVGRIDYINEVLLPEYNKTLAEAEEANNNLSSSTEKLSQRQIEAGNNIRGFVDALSLVAEKAGDGGEYDSAFKGFAQDFQVLQSEFEAGRIGSLALQGALGELVDEQTYASFVQADYNDKMQILQNIMPQLTTMFGDANSAGIGYLAVIQQLTDENGRLTDASGHVVASFREVNGQTSFSIDNIEGLAQTLGVSTGALFAMAEAGNVMGYNFKLNTQDVIDNFKEFDDAITETADGVYSIDWTALSDHLKSDELGYTTDQLNATKQVLEGLDGITLTNVQNETDKEGENAEETKKYVDELNTSLGAIDKITFDTISGNLAALTGVVDGLASSASTAKENLAGLSVGGGEGGGEGVGKATGDSNFKGGLAIVNDGAKVNGTAKELIVQDGRAFMMAGEPALVNLKKGAQIYTAKETQDILGGVPAFAAGLDMGRFGGSPPSGFSANVSIPSMADLIERASSIDRVKKSDGDKKSVKEEVAKDAKEEFDAWLKEKKHALAMDKITEQEYYDELERMNEQYFANSEEYQDDYWKYQEEIYKYRKKQAEDEATAEDEFNKWLNERKHLLAMDEITEQEYYESLEEMNNKYFADSEEYQDEYWRYQEEIYKWRKNQLEDENELLQKQVDIEEALNELAKAKATKKYVYSGGQFGYTADLDAVAQAQANLRQVRGYADGTLGATGGLSLVGEHGAEMRVLGAGDGIIPADITRNLMRIGSVGNFDNLGKKTTNMFNIGSIKLDKVTNVDEFISGLKNLAIQTAGSRAQ